MKPLRARYTDFARYVEDMRNPLEDASRVSCRALRIAARELKMLSGTPAAPLNLSCVDAKFGNRNRKRQENTPISIKDYWVIFMRG